MIFYLISSQLLAKPSPPTPRIRTMSWQTCQSTTRSQTAPRPGLTALPPLRTQTSTRTCSAQASSPKPPSSVKQVVSGPPAQATLSVPFPPSSSAPLLPPARTTADETEADDVRATRLKRPSSPLSSRRSQTPVQYRYALPAPTRSPPLSCAGPATRDEREISGIAARAHDVANSPLLHLFSPSPPRSLPRSPPVPSTPAQEHGIRAGGTKFFALTANERSLYGKKGVSPGRVTLLPSKRVKWGPEGRANPPRTRRRMGSSS